METDIIIDHSGGISTLYGHMQYPLPLSSGMEVQAGQAIGQVGNSGNSYGAHLHFEIRVDGTPLDPLPYLLVFNPTILDTERNINQGVFRMYQTSIKEIKDDQDYYSYDDRAITIDFSNSDKAVEVVFSGSLWPQTDRLQ